MSLISKEHLNLTLQSIKKLLSGKADKSELELKADKSELELKADELQEEISKVSENIVQPDWNQNDPTAINYVENRPFYTNTEYYAQWIGEEAVPHNKKPDWYKVCDNTISFENIIGASIYSIATGHEYKITADVAADRTTYISVYTNYYHETLKAIIVLQDDVIINIGTTGTTFTKGIYLYKNVNTDFLSGECGIKKEKVVQLDTKYIPDSITEAIQPDWNQNDPEGIGYIANRTHYKEMSSTILIDEVITITDPYYEDTEFYYNFGKSLGLVAGNVYNVTFLGETFTDIECDANKEIIFELSNGATILLGDMSIRSYPNDSLTRPFDADIKVIDVTPNIHKLDEDYIPDVIARVEDVMSNYNPVGTGSFSMNRKADTVSGDYSYAEGKNCEASGDYSHAEGRDTTASGDYSHAEGHGTEASGNTSHAEGFDTTASGSHSHAEGYRTTASGDYSHAEGYQTTASGNYSHVQGKFNIQDDANVYAHIVGNGYKEGAYPQITYSNAHTIDWNGVGWFQGGLQVGGNAQDDGARNVLLEGDAVPVPENASVGQTIAVKSVDENGKPVEWETIDISTSGGSGCVVSDTAPEDTSVLWIDTSDNSSDENLGGGIAVTGATVGQTVKISAVDENGVPTAWLPADFPSGGGSCVKTWTKLGEFEFTEEDPIMKMEFTDLGGMTSFLFLSNALKNDDTTDSGMTVKINGSSDGMGVIQVVPVYKSTSTYYVYARLDFDGYSWVYTVGGKAGAAGNYTLGGINTPYALKMGGAPANSIEISQHNVYYAISGNLVVYGGK